MKLVGMMFVIFFLTACSAQMKPLYETKPELPTTPEVQLLEKREIPKPARETLSIDLPKSNAVPVPDNYVNRRNARISFDSNSAPSVVIGVPDEVVQNRTRRETTQEMLQDDLFKTDGYFHIVEQITEKALLRKGFNVIDRSKFEAKLRDLRDKSLDPDNNTTQSRVNRELMEIAKQRYNRGEISAKTYEEDLASIESRGGKKRTKDNQEMVDVSELVRAAQSDGIKADYILQINQASISKKNEKEIVNLRDFDTFIQFLNKNPEINVTDNGGGNSLPTIVEIPVFKTDYNAKLINVETGSIDWLGSHTISSTAVDNYKIDFDIIKTVNNEKFINGAIEDHNRELISVADNCNAAVSKLDGLYDSAMQKQKFDSATERDSHVDDLNNEIKIYKTKISELKREINNKQLESPWEAQSEFHYNYNIQGPYVSPSFIGKHDATSSGVEKIKEHRNELLKETIQNILKTIKNSAEY